LSHLCQACSADRLLEIPDFPQLPRVTSDSKPFRAGGRLAVCESCGLVQKLLDAQWLAEIGEIYRDYEMYHQSAANDQAVFDPVSGRPAGRCEVLAQRLLESGLLPAAGSLLDVGAGSGAMLAAFSAASRDWRLFGLDLDNRKEPSLKDIPRFEHLFTVPPEQVTQQFDLLTLIHSLEHFPDPVAMLCTLRGLIAPGGRLFVQVNNVERTPFDLVVADHLSHFSPCTLAYLVARAGLAVDSVRTDWVNKELSLLSAGESSPLALESDDVPAALARVRRDVAWLGGMIEHARTTAAQAGKGRFGVFGTSVAATWLASGLGEAIDFYVDEDPARLDREHLGRPIVTPGKVPAGATVYLAFIGDVAAQIARRLGHLPLNFAAPPALA
jgi:2-polyprenyl-3-methyl-5-hydroxy-6-metoxy-1,4-benzoquinol methylase